MEFYYDETLRWSFGLDNPNKAAAVLAAALCLAWSHWLALIRSDSPRTPWRIAAGIFSAVLVLVGAFLLCKTYSRGGLVAATVGIVYLQFFLSTKDSNERSLDWPSLILLIGVVLIIIGTGLGKRSLTPIAATDDSVSNRLVLWRHALQIAVDVPQGVGLGRSGEVYMQWYQPLDQKTSYRTMVNSYLTLLVEHGWIAFGTGTIGALVFWQWTRPKQFLSPVSKMSMLALRAALLALIVAGVFSTVWEARAVWISGLIMSVALAALCMRTQPKLEARDLLQGLACAGLICFTLAVGGWSVRLSDGWQRIFTVNDGSVALISMIQRHPNDNKSPICIISDNAVMGSAYGKLLRRMAEESGHGLSMFQMNSNNKMDGNIWFIVGHGIEQLPTAIQGRLILLMPVPVSSETVHELALAHIQTTIFLPGFDEDGRANFWKKAIDSTTMPEVKVITLNDVGIRVDWAWRQVIEAVR